MSSADRQSVSEQERVATGLQRVLDTHGYGFQYAVLRRAQESVYVGDSRWSFEAAEFPVEVQGQSTRIDLVLKHGTVPVYLVGECKRVDPALADWCFAKAPYTRRNPQSSEPIIVDRVRRYGGRIFAGVETLDRIAHAYRVAVELRTDQKGDGSGSSKAIEGALTQVLRGSNGFIEFLARNAHLLADKTHACALPVIFTTAQLWTTDAKLDEAEIGTGHLVIKPDQVQRAPWLVYQYHPAPSLKHTQGNDANISNLGAALETEFTRSVVIVTAGGIREFFLWTRNGLG